MFLKKLLQLLANAALELLPKVISTVIEQLKPNKDETPKE